MSVDYLRPIALICLVLGLPGCESDPDVDQDYECTLFVISEENDVARPYLACADQYGATMFLWMDEYEAAPPLLRDTPAWIDAHRLPEAWFGDDFRPLPGTPPTLAAPRQHEDEQRE